MPRGGRSSSRSPGRSSFAASKPATRPPPPPAQRPAATQPAQSSGGLFSGFGSMMMTGLAFGAGSEVAHQAVRGVMGGSNSHEAQQAPQQPAQTYKTYEQQIPQQSPPCQFELTNFTNCLKDNKDISYCQRYSDILKMCQDNLK